jgi:hypothetical protein
MGWFFRRSAKFGPFRLNFSKSGIGVSAGFRGARISTGPKGTYVNMGTNGLYYRQKIGAQKRVSSSPQAVNPHFNPTIKQLPSSLNYPVFPRHGLPRIVTTFGLLSIPLLIFLLLVGVVAIGNYSSISTRVKSNNDARPLVGTNGNSSMSNSERGFQAGFDYGRTQRTTKSKKLSQRSVKKVARQMSAITKENDEWELGWIEGYNKAVETSAARNANANANSAVSEQSTSRPILTPPIPRSPVRSVNNGYIRGPRGGCYYISSSGRKVYVDRGLCN